MLEQTSIGMYSWTFEVRSYYEEKLPQISKYGIHIAYLSIQSNSESAEVVNFWSSPIQIRLD